jgi:iron(III) transport system permease protein
MQARNFLLPAIVALLSAAPLSFFLFGSFWSSYPGLPGHLTLQNYFDALTSTGIGLSILNTVEFAVGSALLSTIIGSLLAFVVSRTDAYLRRVITYSLLIILALPWFVEDISWTYLANPSNGLLNLAVRAVTGSNVTLFNVYTLYGMVVVMGLNLSSLAYLVIYPSMKNVDPALEESARISGAGPLTAMLKVDLSLARPAIIAGFLLCFIIAAESFDIAAVIGAPAGVSLLSYEIYRATYITPPQYGLASAISTILVIMTSLVLVFYLKAVRVADRYTVVSGRLGRPSLIKLGRLRAPVSAVAVLYFIAYPLMVLGTLLFASLHSFWNPSNLGQLTLVNYLSLSEYPTLGQGIFNSITVSFLSATGCVVLAFYFSYSSTKVGGILSNVAQFVSGLPLAVPAIVIGLSIFWLIVYLPFGIFGSVWALILAYIIRYLPIATRFLSGPILQIHRELEEVSRISGATALQTVAGITLPLLRPAFLISLLYVFVVTVKDLGVAVMLVSERNVVLSYSIYTIWLSGHYLVAAAASILLVLGVASVVVIVSRLSRISPATLLQPERRERPPLLEVD